MAKGEVKKRKEFPLWYSGVRIRLQRLGLLQRCGFEPQPDAVSKDPVLLCCGSVSISGLGNSICRGCSHRGEEKAALT